MTAAVVQLVVLLQCVVLLWGVFAFKSRTQYEHYGQYDAFLVARCEAHCWLLVDRNACVKACLLEPFNKPGRCPKNDTILTPFDAVCLDACREDIKCFGLTKCCRHSCGITCQYPEGLSSAYEVPNIPLDIKVSEGPKKRTLYLEWTSATFNQITHQNTTVLYVIEERHHTGHNFVENHLTEWSFCARSTKENYTLKRFVKPGRWYQFRVAAVNENGTKGFSENSPIFNIAAKPKPPKAPQNVTITALWTYGNGSLAGELHWLPPRSDLPIQRYKVFWSKRLHGAKPLDSVLVHQQLVPKDQNKFLLQDLQPNSLYFLQIQALVQYGRKRLKGQKSALVLNTTNYTNVTHSSPIAHFVDKNSIEGLRVQKMYWSQDSLRVRISWKPKKESIKYTVTLWNGSCYENSSFRKYFKLAATTKVPYFDLLDLHFNCRYKVGVRSILERNLRPMEDTIITFVTPSCHAFKKINQKTLCTK